MNLAKHMFILAATTLWAGAALAEQYAVVGLYQDSTSLNVANAVALGCEVQRSGDIVAMQGKLSRKLPQPQQFALLVCDQPVIGDANRLATISTLSDDGSSIALFEGALTNFETLANAGDASKRQYVLKLGYYNNRDVKGRNDALVALDALAGERDGVWNTESFIQVHSASGITTPDEVVVLYYDTPEIAESFRDENSDILEEVTMFNNEHLTEFSYFIGVVSN